MTRKREVVKLAGYRTDLIKLRRAARASCPSHFIKPRRPPFICPEFQSARNLLRQTVRLIQQCLCPRRSTSKRDQHRVVSQYKSWSLPTSSRFSNVVDDSILLALLTRVLCGIRVLSRRWTETGNLNDNSFITGLCEVIPRGRFGVETAWWQGF